MEDKGQGRLVHRGLGVKKESEAGNSEGEGYGEWVRKDNNKGEGGGMENEIKGEVRSM